MMMMIIIIIINHQRSTTKGLFRLARWSRQGHGAIWWFFPDTLGWLWQLKTLQYTAVSHVFVCFLLVILRAIYKTIQIRWEDNCTIHVFFCSYTICCMRLYDHQSQEGIHIFCLKQGVTRKSIKISQVWWLTVITCYNVYKASDSYSTWKIKCHPGIFPIFKQALFLNSLQRSSYLGSQAWSLPGNGQLPHLPKKPGLLHGPPNSPAKRNAFFDHLARDLNKPQCDT